MMRPIDTDINNRIVTIWDVEFSLKIFLKFNLCKEIYDTEVMIRKIPKNKIIRYISIILQNS